MAVNVVINGTSYSFPETFDENWGDNVTNWAVAVSAYLLQRTGGSFPLSGETDFGGSFGLKALYLKSRNANPASTGIIRLGSTEAVSWRNNANGADLPLTTDASDNLTFNGVPIATSGAIGAANTVYVSNGTNPTWALLVNANINAAAAIAYSKLALTGSIVNADISASAAIAYSKLALTGSIVNADINASAAIAYSKLNLSASIVNADIASAAAIATNKIAALSGSIVAITDASGFLTSSTIPVAVLNFLSGLSSNAQTQIDTKLTNPLTTTGDTIYSSSGSTAARLAIGSTGQVLTVAGGVPTWAASNSTINVAAKTANYTLLTADQYVSGDATGGTFAFDVTNKAVTGTIFYLQKIDSTFTAITTTGGLTTSLNTQGEMIQVLYNGSAFVILERRIPSEWTTYTMVVGATTTGPTQGAGATNEARYRRSGDSVEIILNYRQAAAGSAGTGAYLFPLPSGLALDTAKASINSTAATATTLGVGGNAVGNGQFSSTASGDANFASPTTVSIHNTTNLTMTGISGNALEQAFPFSSSTNVNFGSNPLYLTLYAKVPVSGWKG